MKLVITEEGARSELPVGDLVRVGRAIDNDVRLMDTLVSRHHCRIERDESGLWVADLGSANGTAVNGEKVQRRRVAAGDTIQVGQVRMALEGALEERASEDVADELEGEAGLRTITGEERRERERVRVFAKVTRELARETELAPLLRLIVDSAVALVRGERGFVLLRDGERVPEAEAEAEREAEREEERDVERGVRGLTVRVARTFDRSDIPVPASRLSMGIAGRVLAEDRATLSVDAGRDERFRGMASVEDLQLRSVMCLPIRIEGKTAGVLYVDNRLQDAAFAQADLELAELFADQAAIAILNARRVKELRDRATRLEHSRRQIERLNEQLGRKVRDRDTELAVVRAELGRERGRYDYGAIVGASDGMRRVFQQLDKIIETHLPVLIHGESGTGKELIARAIHYNGPRRDKPFVTENCAALPDTLLESELFGHARGAFTGAHKAKKGLLEQADGGTLFLDEIGDMSTEMQKKLLRVLQEGECRPLGSDRVVEIDVRLLAASHHDLEAMVREGTFREDLFYRVKVLSVDLPPLRARTDDIPLLAEALLARAAREAGRPVPILPHDVLAALVRYDWPGNVRELENEMRRLVVLSRGEVTPDLLSSAIHSPRRRTADAADAALDAALEAGGGNIRDAVAELEQRSIVGALEKAGGNKSRAAADLGISRFALQRKLEKYGLVNGKRDADDGALGADDAAGGVAGAAST